MIGQAGRERLPIPPEIGKLTVDVIPQKSCRYHMYILMNDQHRLLRERQDFVREEHLAGDLGVGDARAAGVASRLSGLEKILLRTRGGAALLPLLHRDRSVPEPLAQIFRGLQ